MIWLWLFLVSFIVRLAFWLLLFVRSVNNSKVCDNNESVSMGATIIVCARNEAHNLQELIPLLCNQKLSPLEILIVDHASTDGTQAMLDGFANSIDHNVDFRYITINNATPGKKIALNQAIKLAKYELILLTDADCRPASPDWARLMLDSLNDDKEIVLGFSPMLRQAGLANYISRFETLQTALQYSSFANLGMAYMSVGRNWGFKRSLYYKVDGNSSHAHLSAGDDDLQLQAMATSTNVVVCNHPYSYTFTTSKPTMMAYLTQKARHVGVASHYKPIYKLLLGLLAISHFGFFIFALICMILGYFSSVFWICLGFYLFILPVHYAFFRRFGETSLSFLYPIFDIVFFLLNPVIFVLSMIRNNDKWT